MMNPSVCLIPLIVTPGPAHGVKSLMAASVISSGAARLAPLMVILVMIPFAQSGAGIKIAETIKNALIAFIMAPTSLASISTRNKSVNTIGVFGDEVTTQANW